MKRTVAAVAVILCVVAGGVAALWTTQGAAQGDPNEIHVRVSSYRDNEDRDYEVGDGCSWSLGTLNFMFTSPQLVVRDESNNVIALYTLDDGMIEAGGSGPDSAFCVDEVILTVPDASFYTLYLASLQEI